VLLGAPFDCARPPASLLPWTASLQVAVATVGLVALSLSIGLAPGVGASIGSSLPGALVHAGFIAFGWAIAHDGRPGWRGPALRLGMVVVAVSLASGTGGWAPLAYLAVPVALIAELRRRGDLRSIGIAWPPVRGALVGLAVGAFLGVHLLVAASRTFGHGVRVDAPGAYLGAIAYDVGLSALTAEWLFRGALFSRWWRQWPFGTAAALSVGCAVLRYVLDPNLPPAVEMRLGAAFYTGLLGWTACSLRAWSGSLLPGYLATATFFLAYRALST